MENEYREAIAAMSEELNAFLADLEDIRDDAQDCAETENDPQAASDVMKLDEVIRLLTHACDLLEEEG